MRRSKAPSELKKAKRICKSIDSEEEPNCSGIEDEQYTWGSRNDIKLDRSKRIFNVLWRDISTRKHKTWKGDGTLEVSNVVMKSTLRDETGKYMACSTKFNRNELLDGFQMLVGGKEVEILNEIVGEEQLYELCKRQKENRHWADDEWISAKDMIEEKRKPKGSFKFKPNLVLNSTKATIEANKNFNNYQCSNSNRISKEICNPISNSSTNSSKNSPNGQTSVNSVTYRQYICFLKPSELQQFLFQKVMEHISATKSGGPLYKDLSIEIEEALKLICNHPSLIHQKTKTNKFICNLISAIPDWSEMNPFDSAKLEFVQYFLTDLSRFSPQTCIIFAKTSIVLNMLQGLCNFMNIKCLQLVSNLLDVENQLIEYFSTEKCSSKVLLVKSAEVLINVNIRNYCKHVIIFEFSKNMNIFEKINIRDVFIYNLVTAFSIEELLLLDIYNNDNIENFLSNIRNMESDCCYLHSEIQCNCFKKSINEINPNNRFIKYWKHFKNPFDPQLLKIFGLENLSENIVSIFCEESLI